MFSQQGTNKSRALTCKEKSYFAEIKFIKIQKKNFHIKS